MPEKIEARGFSCPCCGEDQCTGISSRPVVKNGRNVSIRRRRRCNKCDFRFTTLEVMGVQDRMSVNGSAIITEAEQEARRLRLENIALKDKLAELHLRLDAQRSTP